MAKHIRSIWFCLILGLLLFGAACGSVSPPQAVAPAQLVLPSSTPTPFIAIPMVTPTTESKAQESLPPQPGQDCLAGEEHLFAQSIAESYALSYDQIIAWFCAGSEFEDILLALETVEDVDVPVEDLLDRRKQDQSWDQIWKEIGLIP